MPGSTTLVLPTVMVSEATTMNQPPDIDIMVFHTRPGMANGTSSRQKRCHDERPNDRVTSSRSLGTVLSDWYMLKAMFQAWLVKMVKIAASSAPNTRPGNRFMKKTTVKVRKPRIGMDCRISRIGTRMTPARRLFAAHTA